ncbi:MAG: putative toxin-antitoxin system toxin component, PIN family [Pyrinomonadaceae bacterium]
MFRVVIDTNVLVSALRSKNGASYRLLSLVGDARWQVNLSVALVFEYEEVLKRPSTHLVLAGSEVDDVLDYLCRAAELREIFYLWRPLLRDSDDDFIVELAVESNCDFIITFNVKDFVGVESFGIRAITPGEFIRKLGELT